MTRIAKKPRSVKGQKKPIEAPRYSIRIDSLHRRYAIDERTGRRVAVAKAEKARKPKKSKGIPRNIQRSEAAKRGWETRRKRALKETEKVLVPAGVQMVPIEDGRLFSGRDIEERSARYPKVAAAAERAFAKLQHEAWGVRVAKLEGERPTLIKTPRFDKLYGNGEGTRIYLEHFTRAETINDIDRIIERLMEDEEFKSRDLYTLYFSPEVL